MPVVLCGLACLEVPTQCTAQDAARKFLCSFDPELETQGAIASVDVFRLERLSPNASLAADDMVLCQLPGWQFDLQALEDLHRRLEDLQAEHENLWTRYIRVQDALSSLNSDLEPDVAKGATEELPTKQESQPAPTEVHVLQYKLALSEKKQHGMKDKVVALRQEFMQLLQAIGGRSADVMMQHPELHCMANGDSSDTGQSPPPRRILGNIGDRSLSPGHMPQAPRMDTPSSQRAWKAKVFSDRSPSPHVAAMVESSIGQRTCHSPSSQGTGGSPSQIIRSTQSSQCSLRPGMRPRGATCRRGLAQSSNRLRATA